MTTVQHPFASIEASPCDVDTADYATPFVPSEADEAGRLAMLAEREEREEIMAGWARDDDADFAAWVDAMEARYAHLGDGPRFDDDRAGSPSRPTPYPYE